MMMKQIFDCGDNTEILYILREKKKWLELFLFKEDKFLLIPKIMQFVWNWVIIDLKLIRYEIGSFFICIIK